jgi:tape measure domain-containing protein
VAANSKSLRAGQATIELVLAGNKVINRQLTLLQLRARRIGSAFTSIGTLGQGGGIASLRNLFIGSVATSALLWPVKLAANMEHSAATMSVFTESAASAKAMLDELLKFSEVSMIPADDLAEAAKILMRVGGVAEKDVVPAVKSLATLAGGSTEEFQAMALAFAQVGSAGRLQGEEMRQFKNTAFNPLREIAERTGESLEEVKNRMEAANVPFAEVYNSLIAATSAGGRFAGLLETISNTLTGQMMRAWGQFRQMVLPLGQQLLAPLTEFFRALNGAMPALSAFVAENASWIKWVAVGAVGIAGLAASFTMLGLSVSVTGIALGGVASLVGVIGSALAALSSPIVLIGVALGGLAVYFTNVGKWGSQLTGWLADSFGRLFETVTGTFRGIADSLAAGDITAAAEVMWAGLNAIWQEGTHALEQFWIDYRYFFMQNMTNLVFDAQKVWSELANSMRSVWAGLVTESKSAGEQIGHWLSRSSDPQLAAEQDAAHDNAMANIDREGQATKARIEGEKAAELSAIEAARATAEADRNRIAAQQRSAADQEVAAARSQLEAAQKHAHLVRENFENNRGGPGGAPQLAFGGAGGLAGQFKGADAFFNSTFARQMAGGGDEEKQLLRKIEKNTRDQGGIGAA